MDGMENHADVSAVHEVQNDEGDSNMVENTLNEVEEVKLTSKARNQLAKVPRTTKTHWYQWDDAYAPQSISIEALDTRS